MIDDRSTRDGIERNAKDSRWPRRWQHDHSGCEREARTHHRHSASGEVEYRLAERLLCRRQPGTEDRERSERGDAGAGNKQTEHGPSAFYAVRKARI